MRLLHSPARNERRTRRRRGQAIVEFGIIALLFTLLLFGIVDFGLLLNGWISVSSSAREAARAAALGHTADSIAAAARSSSSVPGVAASRLTVVVQYDFRDAALATRTICRPGTGSPAPSGFTCGAAGTSSAPWDESPKPGADDTVIVTVIADQFQVITPLVRPFFGCTDGGASTCYVPLQSSVSMRLEGQFVP
jgi:hypothetical protein